VKEIVDNKIAKYMRSLSQSRDYSKDSPYGSLNIQKTRSVV